MQFRSKLSTELSTDCFQVAVRGPPAPAMKGAVRKKQPSETYWKMDVLLLTNDDLRPLRVQNENLSERKNPIFRTRAGSPACGGRVHEEEEPRAARRKNSFRSVFDAELDAEDARRRPQAKKLPKHTRGASGFYLFHPGLYAMQEHLCCFVSINQ